MKDNRIQTVNNAVIDRYTALKDRLEEVINRGNNLLISSNLSAERREAIRTRLYELESRHKKVADRINLFGTVDTFEGSLIHGEDSIIDNKIAQAVVDKNEERMDQKEEKIEKYQEFKDNLETIRDSRVKTGLSAYADRRMQSLKAKNACILKSQTKIADNNAKRACQKISSSVYFHQANIDNEIKLEEATREKETRNEAIDEFGKISRFTKVASKFLKVTNVGVNARIIALKAKSGILNVAEKISDVFKKVGEKISDKWENSKLKEKLGRLKNFKQGVINGWNEFKETMRTPSTMEPVVAPAR